MTQEQYNYYFNIITFINSGGNILNVSLMDEATKCYKELTGKDICTACQDQVLEMIDFIKQEANKVNGTTPKTATTTIKK